MDFKLVSDYAPMGDQPEAIGQLVSSIEHGSKHNTLLGVTGSGKTFSIVRKTWGCNQGISRVLVYCNFCCVPTN